MKAHFPSRFADGQNPTTTVSKPLLLAEIASAIKLSGGTIWLLQKLEYGSVLRAEIGPKQFRVILPALLPSTAEVPYEPNSQMHIVQDMDALRIWLAEIVQSH